MQDNVRASGAEAVGWNKASSTLLSDEAHILLEHVESYGAEQVD